jgi:hypothetical protein
MVVVDGSRYLIAVDAALDDEPPTTDRDKLLEHVLEVLRDLLECALDCLVLALVENLDELLDRLRRLVEVVSALSKTFALFREVTVLFEGLLVHVRELFQSLLGSGQLLDQLVGASLRVLVERLFG